MAGFANAFNELASHFSAYASHYSDLANELEGFANRFSGPSDPSEEQRRSFEALHGGIDAPHITMNAFAERVSHFVTRYDIHHVHGRLVARACL